MKRRLVYLLLIALTLAALYGLKEYFRVNQDLANEPPVATLTANALIEAFEKDSAQSSRQYIDRVVAVKGKVKEIQDDGNPIIITLGVDSGLSSVQCSMDSTHAASLRTITRGTNITLKGMCLGAISQELFGTDVKLNRCLVIPER